MLFNPTPLEKLTTLTTDLTQRYRALEQELETLRTEMTSVRANETGKDGEIERLSAALAAKDEEIKMYTEELSAKDAEIEAIVAKIESLLA